MSEPGAKKKPCSLRSLVLSLTYAFGEFGSRPAGARSAGVSAAGGSANGRTGMCALGFSAERDA